MFYCSIIVCSKQIFIQINAKNNFKAFKVESVWSLLVPNISTVKNLFLYHKFNVPTWLKITVIDLSYLRITKIPLTEDKHFYETASGLQTS